MQSHNSKIAITLERFFILFAFPVTSFYSYSSSNADLTDTSQLEVLSGLR